jgi:hypothetical protein
MKVEHVAIRAHSEELAGSHTWVRDLRVEWQEEDGEQLCLISVISAYRLADVRLILRRGPSEQILGSNLAVNHHFETKQPLAPGDEIELQWRPIAPTRALASSTWAELIVKAIDG